MKTFDETYSTFMERQLAESKGDRRERLSKGLGYAETEFLKRVWFPAIGHFDCVDVEWEVRDYQDKPRFIDVAYRPPGVQCAFEVLGFGPHARDVSRGRFKDVMIRHSFLELGGWSVLPIAFDWVLENPRACQQFVLAVIGRYVADPSALPDGLDWLEQETLRFARRHLLPFTPDELAAHVKCSNRYVRDALHRLVQRGLLIPVGGTRRFRRYRLPPQ